MPRNMVIALFFVIGIVTSAAAGGNVTFNGVTTAADGDLLSQDLGRYPLIINESLPWNGLSKALL